MRITNSLKNSQEHGGPHLRAMPQPCASKAPLHLGTNMGSTCSDPSSSSCKVYLGMTRTLPRPCSLPQQVEHWVMSCSSPSAFLPWLGCGVGPAPQPRLAYAGLVGKQWAPVCSGSHFPGRSLAQEPASPAPGPEVGAGPPQDMAIWGHAVQSSATAPRHPYLSSTVCQTGRGPSIGQSSQPGSSPTGERRERGDVHINSK